MPVNYRRCISCRRMAPKGEFWRVVRVHPSRTVELDQGMGRSAYICPTTECLRIAQKKNRLSRALGVNVPNEIYSILGQRLKNNCEAPDHQPLP